MAEFRGGTEDAKRLYHVTVTRPQVVSFAVPTQLDEGGKRILSPGLQCQAVLGFPDIKNPNRPRYSDVLWFLSPEDTVGNKFEHDLVAEKFINLKGSGEYLAVPPEIDDEDWRTRDEELKEAEKLLKHFVKRGGERPFVVVDDPKDQAVITTAVLARQRKYAKEVQKDPLLPQKLAS